MANFNYNKVFLGGRLTGDPELRQTQSGIPVASFSIAVNRRVSRSQEQTADPQTPQQPTADFFNVTAWRQQGEFVARYFRKGSSIFVVGTIQNRSWTDQQGAKHYATDIVADDIQFVDSRAESQGAAGGAPYGGSAFQTQPYQSPAQSEGVQYTPDSYAPRTQSAQPAQQPAQPAQFAQQNTQSAPQFETVGDDAGLPF